LPGTTPPSREMGSKEPSNASLDELLASAASTPSSTHHIGIPPCGAAQRSYSVGGGVMYPMNDGPTVPPSMLPAALGKMNRAQSYSYGSYHQYSHYPQHNQQHQYQYQHQYTDPNLQMPTMPQVLPPSQGPVRAYSSSENSQNVGLTLDDSDNSHLDCDQQKDDSSAPRDSVAHGRTVPLESSGNWNRNLTHPSFMASSGEFSPSSASSSAFQPTLDIKKAFTNFHNTSKFARDSTSAFLGGDTSSNVDLAGAQDSYVSYHATLMRATGGCSVLSSGGMSERDLVQRFPRLETVDEQDISIHKGMRLLKPVQGTESWQQGRRYLIAPAAMAACPLPAINRLSGSLTWSATEAATLENFQGFGTIDLGEALMTYVGEKHHLSLGKWSSCRLVLRQNYLFEYELSTPLNGLPRGFVHLQYAFAHAHPDFQDALLLEFYASPCAKADQRTLMIQVQSREERDHWVTCFNNSANLRMEDLWDFNRDRALGTGRYASVVPATRKTGKLSREGNPDCALKIVDKNQFWRRVVKGRERPDTLVRELAVQSTLTAKCGRVPTFVQLRGFFETSDYVVIELELLEGMDLFEYVKSKGVLSEQEAGLIIQDVLTSLDCMNRNGLAHRDVKPANILMSNSSEEGTFVKLGDFGMSTFVGVDGLVRGRCGTPGYVAPEILTAGTRAGYCNQVDVFSAGVTLYVMLSGYEPFYGETEKELVEANKSAEIAYPKSDWAKISPEALDLVKQMLKKDPSDRISAKEALQHPWLSNLDRKQGHDGALKNPALPAEGAPKEGVCVVM